MRRTKRIDPVLVPALACALCCALPGARAALASPVEPFHPGGVSPGDTLVIEYPVLQSPILQSLRSAPDAGTASDSTQRAAAPARADSVAPADSRSTPTAPSSALAFAGSKTLSVEMGRGRDASLHQTLDLTVRGKIAGEVELSASLSDQQLPFEPDGSTRELQDLDRLLLSVRAPHGEVTLGDFRLDGGPGEFARLSRQLQGVRGQARLAGTRWDLAAASAKGQRQSLEIKGEEGKQGPYELVPRAAGELPAGIVAGSEVVWLNGARLKRGADQDYVVDYGAGTVTFTTRHPISAESRIAFDFERATTSFRRSLYAASTQGGIGSAGAWYATYVRDGDDPKSPLEVSLTPEDVQVLGTLGDSAAASSGARYVGTGNGSYAWDETDPTNPHWVHLGAGRGDYLVEFTLVGVGRGAYADTMAQDGGTFYQFMGRNLGSYTPGRSLPSPDERRLVDIGGSARIGSSFHLEAEAARSGLDLNELSSLDDGDNSGNALRLGARLDPRPLAIGGRSIGSLRFSGSFRSRDARFTTMDRLDPMFENDRWNQAAVTQTGETRGELGLSYDPVPFLSLHAEAGRRSLAQGSRSVRRGAGAEWRGALVGGLRWEGSRNVLGETQGSRSRLSFDLARERGFVTPRVRLLDERIERQEGDSIPVRTSREWLVGLGVSPVSAFAVRGAYSERLDRKLGAASGDSRSDGATWEAGISARSRASLSVDLGWTRRRVDETWAASSAGDSGMTAPRSSTTDLAQLMVLAGAPGSALTSELRYDATQLREPEVVRRVIPVDSGAGSYDAFGNPSYGGSYQVVTSTGVPVPRTRANVQVRIDAYPGRSATAAQKRPSFWRAWGTSTFLRVETLTSIPLGNPARAIDPASYLDAGATIRGTMNARQTIEYAPRGGRWDSRLELGARRDRQGDFQNLRVLRHGGDARLRVRNPLLSGLRLTTTLSIDGTTEQVERTDSEDRYASALRGRGLDLELSRALGPTWSVSLLGRGRRDLDRTRGGQQETVAAGPSARCASAGKLRLDGRALWARTTRTGLYQPAVFFLPAYLGSHLDYDLAGDYRLRDQVSLSLTWNGQVASGRAAAYTGRLELRSYF